jgi:putative hydrolase of the HAD superfamily
VAAITVAVFDIDDTLYLERDYVRSGFAAVDAWCREHLGRRGFGELAWQAFEGGTRGDIFDRALRQLGLPVEKSLVDQLVAVYRTHDPQIALLPDAAECLAGLRGCVKLAAISDGPLSSQRAKARRLGLDRWMDQIVLTAALGSGFEKPCPKAFQKIEEAFQCAGPRCLYVADNPQKDFQAPRVLGWRTVRVRRPGGLHAASACPLPVDLVVEDLRGIPSLFG